MIRIRRYNPKAAWLLAGLCLLSFVGGTVMVASAGDDTPDAATAVRELSRRGQGKQDTVVARVNGRSISLAALEWRIYALQSSPQSGASRSDMREVAMDGLIRDAVLVEAAPSLGITVTWAEASEFALAQAELSLESGDPELRAMYEAAAEGAGFAVEEFASQPVIIDAYQRTLTLGRVRGYVRDSLPATQQSDEVAVEHALDQLAESVGADMIVEFVTE